MRPLVHCLYDRYSNQGVPLIAMAIKDNENVIGTQPLTCEVVAAFYALPVL